MKKTIGTLVMAAAVVMNFTACGEDKKDNTVIAFDRNSAPEQIALAGEQLVNPSTFHLADRVFDLALEKDPNNKRALFYKHLLKPVMTTQGVLARLQVAAKERGQSASLERTIRELPTAPLKDFLTIKGNKADIRDERTAQDALVEIRDAFINASRWLKTNAETELDLNMNPYVFQEAIAKRQQDACSFHNDGERYEFTCDQEFRQNLLITKVNSADLRSIQHVYAGYALALMMYTNYSFEGLEDFTRESMGGTPEQNAKLIQSYQKLGTLRKDHSFSFVQEMGADLIASMKWAMKYQDRLCPKGPENSSNRKGYLADEGLCIKPGSEMDLNKSLQMAQNILSGPVRQTVGTAPYSRDYTVNYATFWLAPLQDIKATAMPASFNECGKGTSFADKTLGGLLPDGNADDFLDKRCN